MNRTILVATDGSTAALGALRFAKALAEVKGYEVHVLGVVEPVPVFDAGFMVALPEMELYEARREAMRQELVRQLEGVLGSSGSWPLSISAGVPSSRIASHAEELGAGMILMGLGRHGPVDRVFGTETTLQVLRLSRIPVLAVPDGAGELPRSAVLGVDFSVFSQRAARAAAQLLSEPCQVHLVHVLSGMEFLPTLSEDWRGSYEGEIQERLSEIARDLEASHRCITQLQVLEGEPSQELLRFAEAKEAGLLAAGSHGHSFVGRLLMGSVTTRLIRSSSIPVLVVPPAERPHELLEDMEDQKGIEGANPWVKELQEFTRRNAGRRSVLEVEDAQGVTRECGKNLPLRGVDYDPRNDRVDIMLGRSGTVEGHLTHSLSAPRGLQVIPQEGEGREALRIDLPKGTAVLHILR